MAILSRFPGDQDKLKMHTDRQAWAANQALHADPGQVGTSSTVIAVAVGFHDLEAWCPQALGR